MSSRLWLPFPENSFPTHPQWWYFLWILHLQSFVFEPSANGNSFSLFTPCKSFVILCICQITFWPSLFQEEYSHLNSNLKLELFIPWDLWKHTFCIVAWLFILITLFSIAVKCYLPNADSPHLKNVCFWKVLPMETLWSLILFFRWSMKKVVWQCYN